MKKIFTILLIFSSLIGFSQNSDPIIKFKANASAEVWIGREWDLNFDQLNNPLNIEFDGKKLKMYYDNGMVYWEQDVLNFDHKEKRTNDRLENEVYILEIERNEFIQYLIIEKQYFSFGEPITQIKIPFFSDIGQITNYRYFQEF